MTQGVVGKIIGFLSMPFNSTPKVVNELASTGSSWECTNCHKPIREDELTIHRVCACGHKSVTWLVGKTFDQI